MHIVHACMPSVLPLIVVQLGSLKLLASWHCPSVKTLGRHHVSIMPFPRDLCLMWYAGHNSINENLRSNLDPLLAVRQPSDHLFQGGVVLVRYTSFTARSVSQFSQWRHHATCQHQPTLGSLRPSLARLAVATANCEGSRGACLTVRKKASNTFVQ